MLAISCYHLMRTTCESGIILCKCNACESCSLYPPTLIYNCHICYTHSMVTHMCNMRDIEHACSLRSRCEQINAEQTSTIFSLLSKRVIQASIASSHRVGKCIFEPSKQSRIRKSSFWSHRRSTVQWETALSSKERSRRVNCPMVVL